HGCMGPSLPILVIGCGSIGSRHARNARTLGATRLLLFDPDETRSAMLADEVGGVPVPALPEALSDERGIAFVCSPSALHLEHALAAARSGWDLFVEKPLAVSTDGLSDLLDEVRERRLVSL